MASDTDPPSADDPLLTPAQYVRGVGPERAALLERLGLRTVADLLFYAPRSVLDLTNVSSVPELRPDEMQSVLGVVVDRDSRSLSRGRSLVAVLLECDGHHLRGVWFNQPWMLNKFRGGEQVLFSGKPKRRSGRWEISNPRFQFIDPEHASVSGGIQPLYGLTEGLTADQLRAITRETATEYAEFVVDPLPDAFRDTHSLIPLRDAVRQLHMPESLREFEQARYRLVLDDLLEFQVGLALRRRLWKKDQSAPVLPCPARVDSRIRRLFPFSFTAGQNQAVQDICADLASGRAMHRLLQADVGAGKTAVAAYALLVAIAAGHQAALMAPTEVLAKQHWDMLEATLAHSRVRRICLTGTLTAAQRREALMEIRQGDAQLIVGTQAIIQSDVQFHNLGLAVIDEQHKFGVMQRAEIAAHGTRPHLLVMTATPIPRSLCLTQFGDLDVSVMTDLPPGRQRVITSRVSGPGEERKVFEFLREHLRAGRQAYVVCPRVDKTDEADGGESAEAVFASLQQGEFADFQVGLVHGQMDRDIRSQRMAAFRDGRLQVLVATTVIEVGVDVSNATLMMIRQAERFGLSQLHQLRGRVGRGQFQGYCFLCSQATTPEADSRLSAMEEHTDGFRIAEADFELRGPGDILGVRQSGQLPLRLAHLVRDADVLTEARKLGFQLVDSGDIDQPEFRPLKAVVLTRFGRLLDLPESG